MWFKVCTLALLTFGCVVCVLWSLVYPGQLDIFTSAFGNKCILQNVKLKSEVPKWVHYLQWQNSSGLAPAPQKWVCSCPPESMAGLSQPWKDKCCVRSHAQLSQQLAVFIRSMLYCTPGPNLLSWLLNVLCSMGGLRHIKRDCDRTKYTVIGDLP